MNNNILHSFIGQSTAAQHARPKRGSDKRDLAEDLDKSFSKFLSEEEDKTDKSKSKEKGKTETSLIDGKSETKEGQKKAVAKKETSAQEKLQKEIQQQIRKKMTKMSPMLNQIYNLMYKNPDALSMIEKKAAGLDVKEFMDKYDVEFKELKNMLSKKGLKLSDLNFKQIAKLAQQKTKSGIDAYLDKVAMDFKTGKEKKAEKKSLVEIGKKNMEKRAKGEIDTRQQPAMVTGDVAQALKNQEANKAEKGERAERAEKSQKILDQIIKQVDIRNLNNKTELVLKLNPEYMGDLKMKIDFEEGNMNARFETTSKEVKELLNESMEDLAGAFRSKGLKLKKTTAVLVDNIE